MTNQPPVEVYEGLYKLNRELLSQELDSADKNISIIYDRFRRMMNALEYVEQYKLEKAREGKL
jgi:hypothetical protein